MYKLLNRDSFRKQVFERDNNKCIFCDKQAKDAHHIIERRLWPGGGYYLENGASLCEEHHLKAESTQISCNDIREKLGIKKFPIPPHLYSDQEYDKWGNPILSNGLRLKGELFEDESVQKIIKPVLNLFVDHIKYPRTYHLPWSPGLTKDDRQMSNISTLENADSVVVTVKMDGECTTMYNDYIHARSIDYNPHPSRSWVKSIQNKISFDIPKGWRVCGENLFAKHSISYENLDDYFLVFSIWNDKNICLSWEETKEWCELLGLKHVPVIYEGKWYNNLINSLYNEFHNNDECEGYVIRVSDSFPYKDFRNCVGKYVRKNHVQTHGHWMRSKLIKNKIRG